MRLYLAPMEGITGYLYRNATQDVFGDHYERYFSPFISPRPRVGLQAKERRDLLPENNQKLCLIPQLLSCKAEDFLQLIKELHDTYGYEEFNLNCGCPSRTVVSHGRGAGMLKAPDRLDAFFYEVFSHTELKLSVKTRMGIADTAEFAELLAVYEKYPLTELIVHARVLSDYYKLPARKEAFFELLRDTKLPVIYNGDITSAEEYTEFCELAEKAGMTSLKGVMLGRGAIRDPALGRKIRDAEACVNREEYRAFHDRLFEGYRAIFDGPTPLLFHMKELWSYMGELFPEKEKALKRLRKTNDLAVYLSAAGEILQ